MFRNVREIVAPLASLNNYLLPLWMLVVGGGLLRFNGRTRRGPPDSRMQPTNASGG